MGQVAGVLERFVASSCARRLFGSAKEGESRACGVVDWYAIIVWEDAFLGRAR